jgi:hypothetical protein
MTKAKVAVVLGLLLLALGYTLGTTLSTAGSVTVAGESHVCGGGFPARWLDSGQGSPGPDTRTAAERSLDAAVAKACAPRETRSRWLLWGTLGLGGLLLLSGWTVARELRVRDEEPEPVLSAR